MSGPLDEHDRHDERDERDERDARDERAEHDGRDECDRRDERADHDELSGNDIVNDGPDNGLGDLLGGAFGGGSHRGDEEALRRLLQGAVSDLEPSDGALDHLRRAVPARRARKRQAVVGIAAAVVLIGTAVPAFVHVASSGGVSDEHAINAGHGEQAQGGTGAETGVEGGAKGNGTPSASTSPGGRDNPATEKPRQSGSRTGNGSDAGAGDQVPASIPVSSPICRADQLGVTSAYAGGPDGEGKVYGTFRISNISGRDCRVSGAGSISFQTSGAADSAKISVVTHHAGDAADGLPDPSQESTPLLLKPDTAYEVKFAWVPSETCPTTNPSPTPTPPATDGGTGSTGSTGTDGTDGALPQLVAEDGGLADGSVTVTHTPEAGAPGAQATVPNACAGTIYRTGVLDAS
ncbi:hypothetical protein AB0C77_06140 [Streptomyces sp. NPDC048629]|uniref:hypothetical protein n=1 Tax=Streptomyces sp. NPDC048629 TaxID=3154824 RepID=UPI00341ABD96